MSMQASSSQNLRKGVLWNIVQPGDPYDIRKSMIAKFPGQQTRFMGEDLELVCLLQAAEIQRLCDYLEDFRLRYRELQRRTQMIYGDRHSYEVQIKELTQQLAQESSFRSENQKLKNYLKRLMQSEGLKGQQWQQQISTYQQRLVMMAREKQQMNKKVYEYEVMNRNIVQQLQMYRKKFAQLEGYVQREITLKINNYENILINIRRENQELRRAQSSMSGDNHRIVNDYQIKIKTMISSYEQRISIITRENEQLKRSFTQNRESTTNLSRQYESLRMRFTQVQRNLQNELRIKIHAYQQQITNLTNTIEQLKRRMLMDKDKVVSQYQSKITYMSQQIEKLNETIRVRTQQLNNWQNRNKSMQVDIENSRTTILQLENLLKQERPKIGNYESTITVLNRQKQNMQRSIVELQNQNGQLIRKISHLENDKRNLESSIEIIRRNLNQTQLSITHEWQSKITSYEQRIVAFTSENQNYKRKVTELGNINQNLIKQLQQYRRKLLELQGTVTHDLQIKISNYQYTISSCESKIAAFNQQNQELRRKVLQIDNYVRRTAEYENKIRILEAQIQRLNEAIRSKIQEGNSSQSQIKVIQSNYQQRITIISKEVEEYRYKIKQFENINRNLSIQLQNYKIKIRELEGSISSQWQRKVSIYESRIVTFTEQNNSLKRAIAQLQGRARTIPQYQNKLTLLNKQIDRLNQTIKIKIEEVNTSEMKFQSIYHELQGCKRKLVEVQKSSYTQKTELQSSISNYDNRILIINKQNEDLKRKIVEYENRNRNLQTELENQMRRINEIEGNFSHQWQNKMVTYEKSISNFTQQNEQLRIQISEYQMMKFNLVRDVQSYKRKVSELQTTINQQFQGKFTTYEQRVSIISKQNQELRRRISDYELNNRNILQELQYHKKRCNDLTVELESFHHRYSELEMTTHRDSQDKIASYQQKIVIFSRQIEQLRKRVQQGGDTSRRIAEYESKIAFLSQQVERLNQSLHVQSQQGHQWQNRVNMLQRELENYRRKYGQLQSTTLYQSQKAATYIRENEELKRKLTQFQSAVQILNFELENQKRKIIDYESSIQYEWKSKISNYEHRISIIMKQNEQFKKQINNQHSSSSYKIAEYENKIAMLSQEVERLNLVSRGKAEECNSLEIYNRKLQVQIEQLRRRIGQTQGEHSTEYEKLYDSYILITRQYENSKISLSQYQKSIKKLYSEFDQLQTIMQTLRKQNYILKAEKGKSSTWLQKNKILSAEIDRLTILSEEQKRDLEDYRLRLSDNMSLDKRISEQMALMVVLFAQIQTLRKRVKDKQKQVEDVRRSSLAPFKFSS